MNHKQLMALAMQSDLATLHLSTTAIPVKITKVESEGSPYYSPMTTFECLVVNDDQIKSYVKNQLNSAYGAKCAEKKVDPMHISKVYFNNPVTVVLWADGTKTIVRCQEGDAYSKEVGLAMCFAKKALGNKGNFNDVFISGFLRRRRLKRRISVTSAAFHIPRRVNHG